MTLIAYPHVLYKAPFLTQKINHIPQINSLNLCTSGIQYFIEYALFCPVVSEQTAGSIIGARIYMISDLDRYDVVISIQVKYLRLLVELHPSRGTLIMQSECRPLTTLRG